ncbi:MAG: hypothetical protein R3Y45_03440 [Bacillota bacterium]
MEQKIFETADQYKELRAKKDDLQLELKELNVEIETLERALIEAMLSAEVPSFKRNNALFSMVIKEYPAAVPERKHELYSVLKKKGYEHLFTINTGTLSSQIKELKQNNDDVMPEWLDGLVKVAEKQSIQLRKG